MNKYQKGEGRSGREHWRENGAWLWGEVEWKGPNCNLSSSCVTLAKSFSVPGPLLCLQNPSQTNVRKEPDLIETQGWEWRFWPIGSAQVSVLFSAGVLLSGSSASYLGSGEAQSSGFLTAFGPQTDALPKLRFLPPQSVSVPVAMLHSILNLFSLDKSPIDKLHVGKFPQSPGVCPTMLANTTVLKKYSKYIS